MKNESEWVPVVFAGDCITDDDGDLICSGCGDMYDHCDCPGPTMDEMEYKEENGRLYARPIHDTNEDEMSDD